MSSITPTALSKAAGISLSYASMLLAGKREPSATLAAKIYRETRLKIGLFETLSDADARTAARIHGEQ
jgi:transcriptional regulator with XRE-family HTH domain